MSGDDEVSARAITVAVTSKQSATAPGGQQVCRSRIRCQQWDAAAGESQTDGDHRGPIRCMKIGAKELQKTPTPELDADGSPARGLRVERPDSSRPHRA